MGLMTKATIRIGKKEYTFEGDDLEDAMKKVKYSRVPFSIVRAMGIQWTRKIVWPTFNALQKRGMNSASIDIRLPRTLTSIMKQKTGGSLDASLDMDLDSDTFEASAKGQFTSDGLELDFESEISEPEDTGNALKEAFKLLSSYNVDVEEIRFEIYPRSENKSATISVDTDVPRDIRRKRVGSI